ncbi:hypothetical protein D3C76_1281560 [compost metagenome]
MDPKLNGAAEIGVADPGPAVQHQRQAGLLADGVKTGEIELRLALIFAVGITDCHRQGVDAGLVDKFPRKPRIGEKGFVGMAVQGTALIAPHRAEFRLHRHAHRVAHLHYFPRLADVLLVAQGGTVEHHRAEP